MVGASLLVIIVCFGPPLVLLVGVAVGSDRGEAIDDLHRLAVPDEATFELTKGDHLVYQEVPEGEGDDRFRGVGVVVTGPGDQVVPVVLDDGIGRAEGNDDYSQDNRRGRAIGRFRAAESGTYEVRTDGDDEVVIAVGPELPAGVGEWVVLPALVWMIGGLIVGSLWVTKTAMARSAARNPVRLASVPTGWDGSPPPGPPPPPPPPPLS